MEDLSATAAIQSPGIASVAGPPLIDEAMYRAMYEASIRDPETFWGEHGKRIDWIKSYSRVKNCSFAYPDVSIKWFEDGTLNVSANCIDRHLKKRGDLVAIIWEPDDPSVQARHITYRELYREVNTFANVLKSMGVSRGDRVTIYLPMIPEAAYAMLACARIGAVHSIVFAGFSPDSLVGRITDCQSKLVITADEGLRGGKAVKLKHNTDEALTKSLGEEKVIVIRRTGGSCAMHAGRDFWYHELAANVGTECPPEEMGAEDPLFILYTSGSTGTPKGVVQTQQANGTTLITNANAERYAPYMTVLTKVDPHMLVAWYKRNYPLFQQAYRELGYPRGYFNDRLVAAIDDMLAAPDVHDPIAVTKVGAHYHFVDPQLEALSNGQKLMMRMGSANEEQFKAKLRMIRELLVGGQIGH